ncbi:MAG: DUF6959 family protein [Pelagimonas sp.]|uniref:DUF6959 family protein n=1 Tax=Pelagimonas sp. TaxID=2073170 RepID=UPI003D6B55D1
MREELVEIYSDTTNAAVLRHPERKFPGVLLQGDTLHGLCQNFDIALKKIDRSSAAYEELNEIRNSLWTLKNNYKAALVEHELPMPFSEV